MKVSRQLYNKLSFMKKRLLRLRAAYGKQLGEKKISRERYFQLVDADRQWFKEYVIESIEKESATRC